MIYIIRHEQTDRNLAKRFSGSADVELNQTGIEQSKLLAMQLQGLNFDIAFCSPQKRARQTLEIIYKGHTIFDDRLREINCGEFENTPQNKETMEQFNKAMLTGDKGVERRDDFMKRMQAFCDMIVADHSDKNVFVCTHDANYRYMNYYFCGKPKRFDWSKKATQGEVAIFSIKRRASLKRVNKNY